MGLYIFKVLSSSRNFLKIRINFHTIYLKTQPLPIYYFLSRSGPGPEPEINLVYHPLIQTTLFVALNDFKPLLYDF